MAMRIRRRPWSPIAIAIALALGLPVAVAVAIAVPTPAGLADLEADGGAGWLEDQRLRRLDDDQVVLARVTLGGGDAARLRREAGSREGGRRGVRRLAGHIGYRRPLPAAGDGERHRRALIHL